jgi:uncharacterized cupredoxin-like copper-binding protein
MSPFRRYLPLTVVVVLLTACTGGGGASGEQSEICDAFLRTEQALARPVSDTSTWREDVTAALDGMVTAAPEAIKDTVQQMADSIEGALADEGPNVGDRITNSDAYKALDQVADRWRADNCGYDEIPVSAADYSFSGMPATLTAGGHAFDLTNIGQEVHEMVMVRVNDGVTESAQELLDDDDMASKVTSITKGVAFPGESNTAFANLEAGRYLILCTIPIGTNAENFDQVLSGEGGEQAPHYSLGMVSEFKVEG